MYLRNILFALVILANIFSVEVQAQDISYDIEADAACVYTLSKEGLSEKEYNKGWANCLKAAESGARGAQNLVGMVHLKLGNRDKAIYWLTRASVNGHGEATEQLKKMGIIE